MVISPARSTMLNIGRPNHPLAKDQFERMSRTTKDTEITRYHYEMRSQLSSHLADFFSAQKRFKAIQDVERRVHHTSAFARSAHLRQIDSSKLRSARCRDWTIGVFENFKLRLTHYKFGMQGSCRLDGLQDVNHVAGRNA